MKQEKIHWFLVKQECLTPEPPQKNSLFILTNIQLLHQFNKVLKFKQGERVVLFDGVGTWFKCEIKELKKNECSLEILEKGVNQKHKDKTINLFFSIPKRNKFELIIEKGTEVGVSSFHPIITDRTEKLNINHERVQKILIEACEQSETPLLPPLGNVEKFEKVIPKLNPKNTYIFHTTGESLEIKNLNFSGEVNLLIGPEGGWSPNEIEIFQKNNFKIYKIVDGILKTETACIVIPFLFNIN